LKKTPTRQNQGFSRTFSSLTTGVIHSKKVTVSRSIPDRYFWIPDH